MKDREKYTVSIYAEIFFPRVQIATTLLISCLINFDWFTTLLNESSLFFPPKILEHKFNIGLTLER